MTAKTLEHRMSDVIAAELKVVERFLTGYFETLEDWRRDNAKTAFRTVERFAQLLGEKVKTDSWERFEHQVAGKLGLHQPKHGVLLCTICADADVRGAA